MESFKCGSWKVMEKVKDKLGFLTMKIKGAFFWDYSGYSHSGLGITEYTRYHSQKMHILKTEYWWQR